MPSRNVHLVGSVPLANAHDVFVTVSAALGPRLLRIPDGETGERIDWIAHLEPVFANHPALEKSDEVFRLHPTAPGRTRYRLKPGASAADVTFENLFYADAIPHQELAIQFDVASAVFARLQRNEPNAYGRNKSEMLDTFGAILGKLADHVPPDVELLFHFCYGDSNHRHVVEPIDVGDMVDLANRLAGGINRSIELIHMPVPRDRSDDAYFEPLTRLKLKPGTQLCLGLVHHTDGLAGTRRRLATAEKYVKNFSIATECGFGRRPRDTISELLAIHAAAAE